jgi:para-nitrobenzyl esterase
MVLAVFVASARAQRDAFVVHTTAGLVRGAARSAGGAQFLGVPYAQPPVGALRWREPVPAKSWTGVRDANHFGAPCAQPLLEGSWNRYDAENGQEDCLYLNVIVPAWPAKQPLPVMFWIHGGANHGGSGTGDLYNEGTLPSHGVVVVTINYRLGVFGFLAHPELTRESPHHASGNYGLMDQILALHWVRDNIAAFGGDPNNVTVFGQSAGSLDAGVLMTSPLAKGLFEKVIAESGAAFFPSPFTLAAAEQQGEQLAANLHVPGGAEGVAALRKIAAADLIAELGSLGQDWPGLGPDVDGWVVPRPPAEVFHSGEEARIPLLIGTTSREFGNAGSGDALRAAIERATGADAPQALELYGLADGGAGRDDPTYGTAGQQWAADSLFHCPIAAEADWHAVHSPTFEYELDHAIPGQEAQGAIHSADLPYVFGSFPKTGNIGGSFGAVDTELADLMETYWTNFARSGDPNGSGLPHWAEVNGAHRFLIFTGAGHAAMSTGPLRAPMCELYRKELVERMKQVH